MKKILLLLPALALIGCASAEFKKGAYEDPKTINLLSDDFSESDAQILAESTAEQLKQCPRISPNVAVPYIIIGKIQNKTEEKIDMALITDSVGTALDHSGRFRIIEKDARQELDEEYSYNSSGAVSADSKKSRGKQKGADYVLNGNLKTIVQEVGKEKTVFYQLNTNLVNLETSVSDCKTEKQTRKQFKKKR